MSGPIQNGFQGEVFNQPAPGVEGDFCDANPRAVVIGGPGVYNAPEDGVYVGRFVWVNPATGDVSQSYVSGYQIGFLHRNMQAVIVDYLGFHTMLVREGLPITLFSQGAFWAKFAAGAQPGQNVYANPGTGELIAGTTAPTTDSFTASAGFTGTASVGGSITSLAVTSNVATISGVTGYLSEGDLVNSTTLGAPTALGAQLTGTPGGDGTYTLTHANFTTEAATFTSTVLNVSAVTRGALQIGSVVTGGGLAVNSTVTAIIAGTGGIGRYTLSGAAQSSASGSKAAVTNVMDVTAVSVGTVEIGDVIAGSGVTSAQVVSQLTGAVGGIGTYQISVAQNFASTTVTVGGILTPWKVNSSALAGELAKISTWG